MVEKGNGITKGVETVLFIFYVEMHRLSNEIDACICTQRPARALVVSLANAVSGQARHHDRSMDGKIEPPKSVHPCAGNVNPQTDILHIEDIK
jgi:hypothetical protein